MPSRSQRWHPRQVNGALSYLASDGQGSAEVALAANSTPQSSKLYMAYGGWRWGSGTLPTARQFTGQVADATSGLDYYNARYYDPALGQFTSADTVLDGLNPYAYTHDNPTTETDPTGHQGVDPWWSPYSMPEPTVSDAKLQAYVEQAYGHGGSIGPNYSTFDALRSEAYTGQPTMGKWHYIKTNDIFNGLRNWLRGNRGTADPADVQAADAMALDATDAGVTAIDSPFADRIPGTPSYGTPPPSGGTPTGGSGPGGGSSGPGNAGTGGANANEDPIGGINEVEANRIATLDAGEDAITEAEMPYMVDSGVVTYDFASETTPTAAPAPTPAPSFWDEISSNAEEVTPNPEEDPLEYFFFALVEDGD